MDNNKIKIGLGLALAGVGFYIAYKQSKTKNFANASGGYVSMGICRQTSAGVTYTQTTSGLWVQGCFKKGVIKGRISVANAEQTAELNGIRQSEIFMQSDLGRKPNIFK